MKNFIKLVKNSKGATAIEYGLIAALIAVAGVAAMNTLSGSINDSFKSASDELDAAAGS